MNKITKFAIGIIISGVCLYFTFRNINGRELLESLKNAHWKWFLLAPVIHVTAFVFRTFRWQILLSPIKKVSFKQLFIIITFGFFVNNILPARMGEFARAYATNRLTGASTSASFGSIAVERTMDLFGVVGMMLLALVVFPADKLPLWPIPVFFLLIFSMFGFFILFEKKGDSFKHKVPQSFHKFIELIHNITKGFSALKSLKKVLMAAALSLLVWGTEVFNLYLVSRAFELDLSYFQAAALIVGLSFGVMIPAAPGFIGTYELFGKEALVLLGFPAAVSLSFVLAVHVFQLIMNAFLGIPGIFSVGLSKSKFKKAAQNH